MRRAKGLNEKTLQAVDRSIDLLIFSKHVEERGCVCVQEEPVFCVRISNQYNTAIQTLAQVLCMKTFR